MQSFWQCPKAPACSFEEPVSEVDPDASFGEVLSHIRFHHPDVNTDPATLWPSIGVVDR